MSSESRRAYACRLVSASSVMRDVTDVVSVMRVITDILSVMRVITDILSVMRDITDVLSVIKTRTAPVHAGRQKGAGAGS